MRLHELKAKTPTQVNEGALDALKTMGTAVKGAVAGAVDKVTDASGEGEKKQYIKQFQAQYIRWASQTQPRGTNQADIDVLASFLATQLHFTPQQIAQVYKAAGVRIPAPKPAKPPQPAQVPLTPTAPVAGQPITIGGQKIMPDDPKYAQIMKSYSQAESVKPSNPMIAEGTKLDQVKYANAWNEIIRQLYATGKLRSNPANNPLNKLGNFVAAMAGEQPIDARKGGTGWQTADVSMSKPESDFVAQFGHWTHEQRQAAINAVNALAKPAQK